jgi:adenosine deaminase
VITGIDILGNETHTPALEKGQTIYATVLSAVTDGKSRLHRTMHAGELGDVRNPRDAMILGSERLGHAVKLEKDPVALEYARRNKIGVEVNLVSNLRLGAVQQLDNHPFIRYLRLGLKPSLSTDDEGMFETDMNRECRTAIEKSDISYSELKQLIRNSIETAFVEKEIQIRLEEQLQRDFEKFETIFLKSL